METRVPLAVGLLSVLVGCSMPSLTRDGQLVWAPGAPRGAAVLTANGVEFIDRVEKPRPVVRSSPYDPFVAPTGFLLPSDGRWHRVAQAVSFGGEGLAATVRLSDALSPSWGGEIVMQLDLSAPDAGALDVRRRAPAVDRSALGAVLVGPDENAVEKKRRVLVVLDTLDDTAAGAVGRALASLGSGDQIAVLDTHGPQVITPWLGRSHRSLIEGAVRRRAASRPGDGGDLAAALSFGRRWLPSEPGARSLVVVVADEAAADREPVAAEVQALERAGAQVAAGPGAAAVLCRVLPVPATPSARDLVLSVSSSPGPTHVIESTRGQVAALLDDDRIFLDDLAGERTEVLRLSVPPFVAGEELRVTLRLQGRDPNGGAIEIAQRLVLHYDDDLERLSRERSGDVIGYASALVSVGGLSRSLFGHEADAAGARRLIDWQREALDQLARASADASVGQRAGLLRTLDWALEP